MAIRKTKVRDAIQGYVLRCQSKRLSAKTITWYSQKLSCFSNYIEKEFSITVLGQVAKNHILSFIIAVQQGQAGAVTVQPRKRENVADLTVKGYVQVLKGFFAWCVNEELIKDNPTIKIENPKVADYIIPTFEAEQLRALFAACNLRSALGYRDHTIMFLLLDTGIRLSELCNLKLEDVHRDYIRVLGKGSKEREVGIHPETAQRIWKYVNKYRSPHDENERRVFINRYGKPLTITGVGQAIRDIGIRAGLSGVRVSPHTFRHTFAVMYLDNGGDVYKLSRELGHSEIGTTEEYLKNFRSHEARRDHSIVSPISRLYRNKNGRGGGKDQLFEL